MATAQKSKSTVKNKNVERGLLAIGSCGAWQIDIDEALSGEQLWAQIEGPTARLYFEIPSVDVLGKMVRYLAPRSSKSGRLANGSAKKLSPLALGGTAAMPVSLVKDDEFDDRFWFVIGPSDSLAMHLVIAGSDVTEIAEALQQVEEDLASDA
jgi:hypothetical protein